MIRSGAIVAILVCATTASADPPKVDWARGLVIADAVGVADRHAPNPAVARGTSRRGAEEAAKKLLSAKVAELPIAGGGKVGDRIKDDDAIKGRLEAAIDDALTLAADPQTDGAWNVTLALPIEAVRQALTGARVLAADGDKGPAVVVVDGVSAKPAVGWKLGGVEAATIWSASVPAWVPKDAPHLKAKRAKGGAIELDAAAGIETTPATLFVIVAPPG